MLVITKSHSYIYHKEKEVLISLFQTQTGKKTFHDRHLNLTNVIDHCKSKGICRKKHCESPRKHSFHVFQSLGSLADHCE